jgi:hypothetical protein
MQSVRLVAVLFFTVRARARRYPLNIARTRIMGIARMPQVSDRS